MSVDGKPDENSLVYLKTRLLQLLMGIFTAKHCCACWCWRKTDDSIPFWTPDSSEENAVVTNSVNESYSNETFDSPTETTTQTAIATQNQTETQAQTSHITSGPSSPRQGRLSKLGINKAPIPPKSPFTSPGRRGSESESEDSFSVSHSETASDQSDVEGRIRALNDELKRRKNEADRLKREQKKRNKDKLRAKEASLKKQIEAYDSYINQVQAELQNEKEAEPNRSTVKPKIKQPAESKRLVKQPEPVTPPADSKPRTESESSHSSTSFEDGKDITDSYTPFSASAHASPITPSPDETPRHQETPSPRPESSGSQRRSGLESISEGLESSIPSHSSKKTSTPEQDSSRRPRSPDKSVSRQDSEILEDIPEEASVFIDAGIDKSELKLDLDEVNDTKDVAPSLTPRSACSDTTDAGDSTKAPDTGRTESAIPEEDFSLDTARSEVQEPDAGNQVSSEKEVVIANGAQEYGSVSSAQPVTRETEEVITNDQPDELSQRSEKSYSTSQRTETSDRSYSYSSTKSSYSDDTSQSSRTSTYSGSEVITGAKTQSRVSEKEKSSQEIEESIHTDEDISEHVLAESDEEDEDKPAALILDVQPAASLSETAKTDAKSDESVSPRDKEEQPIIGVDKSTEKATALPETLKEERIVDEELPSDISEHTLTEEKSLKSDYAVDTEPKTPSKSEASPSSKQLVKDGLIGSELLAKETKDEEESVTEEISIASELERAITSAAAAVEEFDSYSASPNTTLGSEGLLLSEQTSPAKHEPAARSIDEVVDKITDNISLMVVKDTVEVMGHIAEKQVAREHKVQEGRKVEEEGVKMQTTAPSPNNVDDVIGHEIPSKQIEPQEGKQEKAAELAVQNLLNEAISQMLVIRNRQRARSQGSDSDISEGPSVSNKPSSSIAKGGVVNGNVAEQPEPEDPELLSDAVFQTRVQFEPYDEGALQRPVSPLGFTDTPIIQQDDLDKLYDELGALTGEDDEWFDDDFGLGSSHKAPPPYPDKDNKFGAPQKQDLKLDLQKLTEEPFYAVPNKTEEIKAIASDAVDVFWERRRYGESWDNVAPPTSFFSQRERGHDVESNSRRVYKRLVFDLTSEILQEMYKDEEEEVEQPPWAKPKRTRQKYYRGKTPPTTADVLKPIVEEQVVQLVEAGGRNRPVTLSGRWAGRKKKDHVDSILVQELREEEPDWINYDDDELTVKMQLADAIFDSLVTETVSVVTEATSKTTLS